MSGDLDLCGVGLYGNGEKFFGRARWFAKAGGGQSEAKLLGGLYVGRAVEEEVVVLYDESGVGRTVFYGSFEETGEALFEVDENGLGVLAGAGAIGGKVRGDREEEAGGKVDDFDGVGAVGVRRG